MPHTELETWVVQWGQESLPMGFLDHTSPLVRAPAMVDGDLIAPSVESRPSLDTPQEEEEEEEDKEVCLLTQTMLKDRICDAACLLV